MNRQRIVVVEDEPAIRRGVVDVLRASGYEVVEAADGACGQEEAVRLGVSLVLLDLMLPRKDGLEVLGEVRRLRPTLPVIVLTARGSEDDRVRGLTMGADDYVVKPFSARELLARVEAVLRRALGRPPDVFGRAWATPSSTSAAAKSAGATASAATCRRRKPRCSASWSPTSSAPFRATNC